MGLGWLLRRPPSRKGYTGLLIRGDCGDGALVGLEPNIALIREWRVADAAAQSLGQVSCLTSIVSRALLRLLIRAAVIRP